jgi:hypothetical protein
MSLYRISRMALIIAIILLTPNILAAQTAATSNAPHAPPLKTIGQAKTKVFPSLIVFNSLGASLQGTKLVLTGVAANATIFCRPASQGDRTRSDSANRRRLVEGQR